MSDEGRKSPALRLGVIVPCRNEAAVIERKLANLSWIHWPSLSAGRRHRLIVVDDSSGDGTAELARAFLERSNLPDSVSVEVLTSGARPGKCEAVRLAVTRMGEEVDIVVMTDADVSLRRAALLRVTEAFARRPRLALACGAQEFVQNLAPDGACRGTDGGEPRSAAGFYDRATAFVRKLESKFGRLYSVHGQLLAWRACSGFLPTAGIAADDLDLMHQARTAGGRVERLRFARFLEIRTPDGEPRRAQAQRRSRAFFQFLRARPSAPSRDWLTRAHWVCYRFVPRYAVECGVLFLAALVGLAFWLGGLTAAGLVAGAAFGLLLLTRHRLLPFLATMRAARSEDSFRQLTDRWEMQREIPREIPPEMQRS